MTTNKYKAALVYLMSSLFVMQGIDCTSAAIPDYSSGVVPEEGMDNRILSLLREEDENTVVVSRDELPNVPSSRTNWLPGTKSRPRPLIQLSRSDSGSLEELIQNQLLWESWNITYYKMVSQRSCFCTEEVRAQTLVAVDVLTGNRTVVNTETRTPLSDDSSMISFFPSVTDLFDMVADALERQAFEIRVEYDETYGYVKDLYVDYDPRIADEETNIVVRSFFPVSEVEEELESNRLKWMNSFGSLPANYKFAFKNVRDNEGEQVTTYRHASVVNGEFESIFGLTVARAGERDFLHLYTIPGYFDWITRLLRDDTSYNQVTVEYDPQFGFPTKITWDEFWLDGNPVVISIGEMKLAEGLDLPESFEEGNFSMSEFDSIYDVNALSVSGTTSRTTLSLVVFLAIGCVLL